jgi:hypothetical protein
MANLQLPAVSDLMRSTCRMGLAIAAAALAAAAAAQQPVVVQTLECRGEEPGWKLDANRTSALYSASGAKGKREVVFRGSLQALSYLTPPLIVWRGDSTHLPRETLVVTLREEACRVIAPDGPPATHRAIVSVRTGEAASGCCSLRAGYDARVAPAANYSAKKSDDWARLLPDLMPAINACVAREGARGKWVAKAWPVDAGTVTVRIVETSGAAVDCVIDLAGRTTPRIEAAAAPPQTNAGNPLFYPAREQPPIVSCGTLERALNARSVTVGYLHYDPC